MGESSLEVLTAGNIVYGIFEVYSGTIPVTGLIQSNFTTYLTNAAVSSSVAVTISEIGGGRYLYSFTPDAEGEWYILIVNATYNARGWDDEFIIGAGGIGGTSSSSWPFTKDYMSRMRSEYRRIADEDENKRKRTKEDEDFIAFLLTILDDV